MSLPPIRPAHEVAAAAAAVTAIGACCGHAYGTHAPDGCRICQLQGRTAGEGRLCTGWLAADPWSDPGSPNATVIGVEDVDALPCSTEGCGHRADRHFSDGAQPSGLGPCRLDGCWCGRWTYIIAGSEEDALRAAGVVAGAMAEAIGAATSDEETARRTLAALREHRAELTVVLEAPDPDALDAVIGSSGDPLLDLVHDVLARHFPADLDGRWLRARDELTDAVRAAAQVRWS